ncbi:MAG: A/G-specific adenine glycosylase, partial [Alphaproteobacteria bacterium]
TPTIPNPVTFRSNLLAWYARGHRAMPWRDEQYSSPYHIWLAEIMLQQTTVAAVIPYYQRFLARFPTVQSLAQAPLEDILALWQGLGYYRRAHLLHTCAQAIVNLHNGEFPNTEEGLLALPGLGPYTAAVIAATAFNQPANVVDGNVERVISRIFRITDPLPASKPVIRARAATLASPQYPRLYANAIMELGSQVCTPANPQCLICPVFAECRAFAHKDQTAYPVKTPKKAVPHRTATAWVITDAAGNIYLQKRAATGLLASLWELPHSGWEPTSTPQQPPMPLVNPQPAGSYTHTFSHFKLTLQLLTATVATLPPAHSFAPTQLPPLPTLMARALRTATLAAPLKPSKPRRKS